ncbi:MAG: sugar (glycoside-Pentoside-hexuronide) transporter [Ignavibacteria bacterium]|nr:MAG: sugar (glycoside-Pentoside-hexuronide) transporter [Ignavibacteria bacterium]KAF0160852.1 MAG: sugar (glycoside-Pentoside-hexuronide) transporter [Ignavibacteria bacterium]
MSTISEKLSVKEKVGYALGDTAANFIFQTMVMFQLVFYTDTFGISAVAAGTLLVIVRVWDAIFDPIMGIIADRTKTKWGKFRPWILWTALPFGIMGFLTFVTPDFSSEGKLIYAYVTYIILMMIYSANNLPYSALSGVMTGDLGERTSLSSYRFVFAMLAQLIIQGLALPMVHHFGGGDSAKGYQYTMAIFSALAVVLFVITFSTTRERIQPAPTQKATIKEHFADLLKNGPAIAMFFLTIVLFITLAMRGSIVVYYFRYYVGQENLFSMFNVLGTVATIIGIFFSKKLSMRFGKRNVFITGLFGTAFFTMTFIFIPSSDITLLFASEIIRQFVYGFTIPLLWAMMADVADYSEWKNNRRATGIIFAAIVFGLKAGLGFGGAIAGYILSLYGYVPNIEQTASALNGIMLTMSLFPAITFAICAVILFFYKINKQLEIQITDELNERRKSFQS